MGQAQRLSRIKAQLDGGRYVTPRELAAQLEVSLSTVKRDIAHLRDRLGAPVAWCRERRGWHLDHTRASVGTQYELPGLWFSAEEIYALLTMQHLLANLDGAGVLGPHIQPLMRRLSMLVDDGVPPGAEVERRIRVQTVAARRMNLPHFQSIVSALLRRRRAHIAYHGRTSGMTAEREVSPQRLVHYRDNWYLDAWCHVRQALRSFSVDSVQRVVVMDRAAIDVPAHELDAALGSGYGIFAGREVRWATLRFTAERARWVAAERWHREQHGRYDNEGRWLLTLPYADPRELVMDILRHVPAVEVIAPSELRDEVLQRLHAALASHSELDE